MGVTFHRKAFAAMALAAIGFAPGSNGDEPQPKCRAVNSSDARAMHVAASVSGDLVDGKLKLVVTPGILATKGVRIYSEPSHTPLAVVVREDFRASDEGRAWMARNAAEGKPGFGSYDKSGVSFEFLRPMRPETDDRISVWLNGSWPDTNEQREMIVADAKVKRESFGIKVGYRPDSGGFTTMTMRCCTDSYCGTMCIECEGPRMTCCTGQFDCCCYVACGWSTPCVYPCSWDQCNPDLTSSHE